MFRIALRNVFRNKRRTLLNVLMTALGTAALVLLGGYTTQTFEDIKRGYIESLWNLQVTFHGYWDGKFEGYEYILSPERLVQVRRVLSQENQVVAVAEQLRVQGLIGTSKRSTSFGALGVEPDNAPAWVSKVLRGRALTVKDQGKTILTKGLAENLAVDVGGSVSLMTSTVDGGYNAARLEVVGIYDEKSRYAVIPIAFARKLLQTQGAERIYVKLRGDEATETLARRWREAFTANGLRDLEIKVWSDLADFYHQVKDYLSAIFVFVGVVIFGLSFFAIFETLTMAFFERMREIGTIRAIGTKRSQVFRLFLVEGVILGVFGGILGILFGMAIGTFVNSLGITYVPPSSDEPVPFHIALDLGTTGLAFLIALISTFLATLFPAWRAGRIAIADALRYV